MSKRDLQLLLYDILESCNYIKNYTVDFTYDTFINDKKTVDAVIRNFIIIGEATANIEQNFKSLNPQVDWQIIKSFRNRMVHDYTGIDYEVVWDVITNFIDDLELQIQELLK